MESTVSAGSRSAADRWAHQSAAVAAIEKELADGGRATAESACGSGKSRIAAVAADRLVPDGRLLVTVPTLELVAQMFATLVEHGDAGRGRIVAVCSDDEVVQLEDVELDHAAVTTDAAELAELTAGPGRVTVLCTYQSLPVLTAAHTIHGLPPWDLAVIDEAHRTAGRAGHSWAVIHDDVMIPAARRLYMTATRKILGSSGDNVAASMDDEKIYGPVVFRFTTRDGIDRGLLADYQVLVVVVTDEQVRELAETDDQHFQVGDATVSPRMLATQIAVLRAAHDYGIRRAITFHNRLEDAEAWARVLPHAWHMMSPDHRPAAVSAAHIYGRQRIAARREALDLLRGSGASGADDVAVEPFRVVCNSRVLTEGVDAPAVDAVMFVDPRNSVIDTVQAVGRALRTGGRRDKIARIIVPVVLEPDADPAQALDSSAYAQVWRVIRAHDDRLANYLDAARARKSARTRRGSGPEAGDSPDDPVDSDGSGIRPDWLEVCGAVIPAGFASAIQVRAVEAASSSWMEYFGAARAYFDRHGDLRMDIDYRSPDGLRVGEWIKRQIAERHVLDAERKQMLDAIGMIWSKRDAKWQRGLAAARVYAAEHGNLHEIPAEWEFQGIVLHQWVSLQRRDLRSGKLSAERHAALDAVDPSWAQSSSWERRYAAAADFAARNGHLRPDKDDRTYGVDLYAWLKFQRELAARGELSDERTTRLNAIGMVWSPAPPGWERGLAAATAYARDHHNLDVPINFRTPDGFALGQWLASRRKGGVPDERKALLDALDPRWDKVRNNEARWQASYEHARAYVTQHGRLPQNHADPAPEDADFRPWLTQQRRKARGGRLKSQHLDALNKLDPGWLGTIQPPPPATGRRSTWQANYEAARTYVAEHGHLPRPRAGDPVPVPLDFRSWLAAERYAARRGQLKPERLAALNDLDPGWLGTSK